MMRSNIIFIVLILNILIIIYIKINMLYVHITNLMGDESLFGNTIAISAHSASLSLAQKSLGLGIQLYGRNLKNLNKAVMKKGKHAIRSS